MRALNEDNRVDREEREPEQRENREWRELSRAGEFNSGTKNRRHSSRDTSEDDDTCSISETALGDLLAKPHYKSGSRGEGDHRCELKRQARGSQSARLQRPRDHKALEEREKDCELPCVSSDNSTPRLSLFLEVLKIRDTWREKLDDDRYRDVRGDSEREDRELLERASGKEVNEAEERIGVLLKHLSDRVHVHTGGRNENSESIYGEHRDGKQESLL